MKYLLHSIITAQFLVIFSFGSFAFAGDMSVRTCDQSVLKHHPKLLVTKRNDHATGRCWFRADVPPEMASDALTRSAIILRAAVEATDPKELDAQVAQLGPAIFAAFFELLNVSDAPPGFEEALKAEFGAVSACTAEAARKKEFEREGVISLNCGFNSKESNFFFTAVHNDVTLEIVLPLA